MKSFPSWALEAWERSIELEIPGWAGLSRLKVLSASHAFDRDSLTRFTREAKAASALNHPNICTIYEIGTSEGTRFIAMEHIEGTVLSNWAAENRPDIASVLDIAISIADALVDAHGKGIIHRDIKPSNLIVSSRGIVKILDFGLAKMRRTEDQASDSARTATQEGVVLGTVDYMSPSRFAVRTWMRGRTYSVSAPSCTSC